LHAGASFFCHSIIVQPSIQNANLQKGKKTGFSLFFLVFPLLALFYSRAEPLKAQNHEESFFQSLFRYSHPRNVAALAIGGADGEDVFAATLEGPAADSCDRRWWASSPFFSFITKSFFCY